MDRIPWSFVPVNARRTEPGTRLCYPVERWFIHLNSIGDGELVGKVLGKVEDVMKGSRIDDVFIRPVSNQFIIPILFGDHETVVAAIWYDARMLIMILVGSSNTLIVMTFRGLKITKTGVTTDDSRLDKQTL